MDKDQISQLQALAGGSLAQNTHPTNVAAAIGVLAGVVLELARLAWPDQVAATDVHLVDTTVVIDNSAVGVELAGGDAGNAAANGGSAVVSQVSDAATSAPSTPAPGAASPALAPSSGDTKLPPADEIRAIAAGLDQVLGTNNTWSPQLLAIAVEISPQA